MRIVAFASFNALLPYADDWDRLAGNIPFRGWTWLSNWWRHYGPADEAESARTQLAVLGVFDDVNSLMGIAPWYLETSGLHGRVLRPLGAGEVCSDYLSLLCHPTAVEVVIDALADYLVEDALGDNSESFRWDLLELDTVAADDHRIAALVHRLADLGCTTHHRPGVNCWRVDLPADWESYLGLIGRNLRRDLRRLERDYLNTHRAELHTIGRVDDLPEAMDILVDLHQRRRETLDEEGCFTSPRFTAFYRDVTQQLLRQGQLEFAWLELDGRPVAAEYQLAGGGTLYAYQAGIDPSALQHEPGKLITAMLLRRAIERGYLAVDLLRGDETYKARLGAQPRSNIDYRVVPRKAVARFRHGLWLAGNNVKQWMKRGAWAGDAKQ